MLNSGQIFLLAHIGVIQKIMQKLLLKMYHILATVELIGAIVMLSIISIL